MNYRKYKCFLVAASLVLGISLTACGGSEATVESESSETATVENASDESLSSSEAEETTSSEVENNETDIQTDATAESEEENDTSISETNDSATMYTTESITLHKEASGSSEDLGVIAVGSTVEAYETSGNYIRVSFDGKEGYVLKDYVTEDKDIADKALEESKKAAAKSDDKKSSGKDKDKKKSTECLDNGLLN